jgi:hypothetical protein
MQALIGLTELALSLFDECLVFVFLAGAQRGKAVQAYIDAEPQKR